MATGVNYWSSHELRQQVRDSAWDGGHESSSEDGGGGGVTWEPNSMDVKGHLISAPEALNCTDRKQRERMAELQERRRSLQALLSSRLAELRRICLKEAELTGAVPSDFPLDAGEKPPQIRRRGGNTCPVNRKCQEQEEDCPRLKPKKHLFSGALRKNLSEHNTHSHHGKRTVHRGCHTDEAIRSESSSTSDSTGHNNEDGVSQCLPPLVSAGSPTELFYQNKSRKSSFHTRMEPLQPQKHLLLPSSHLPPPPPRSQDSSSSSDPASGWEGGGGAAVLERITPPQEERAGPGGGAWVNGSRQTAEILTDGQTRSNRGACEVGGRGSGPDREGEGARGVRYSELLLDYVWGKQQQLQRQQSKAGKQPITVQHQMLFNGYSSQPLGAPPTYHGADQRRVTVTRTKSCGPFLPAQPSGTDAHNPSTSTIQPDPHPHLLPPRPPQLPPQQDSQLEDATRSLHKALALEGLRDWYLRNTLGSSHHQTSSKATVVTNSKMNAGVKSYSGEGGALQRRRTTHSIVQPSTYQTEAGLQHAMLHPKPTLPHSATFHGHPLHGRSDSQKQDLDLDQPSPGTLV